MQHEPQLGEHVCATGLEHLWQQNVSVMFVPLQPELCLLQTAASASEITSWSAANANVCPSWYTHGEGAMPAPLPFLCSASSVLWILEPPLMMACHVDSITDCAANWGWFSKRDGKERNQHSVWNPRKRRHFRRKQPCSKCQQGLYTTAVCLG